MKNLNTIIHDLTLIKIVLLEIIAIESYIIQQNDSLLFHNSFISSIEPSTRMGNVIHY